MKNKEQTLQHFEKHIKMKTFLIIISLLLFVNCQSQIKEEYLMDKSWGEINDVVTKHRGKSGLILMKLNSNHTFQAFENTDFGAAVLQKGNWILKNNHIIFDVLETKNYAKHTTMKGRILSEKEVGKIKYKVVNVTDEKLILSNQEKEKRLVFELSEFKYLPNE